MVFRSIFILSAVCLIIGCQATVQRGADSVSGDIRNPQLAAELTQQAIDLMTDDSEEAMRLLRAAIDADLYHGPAHNNLGVLLLNNGELYAAAEEFDLARRLMPGHPDPRVNLGIALERGGKTNDALETYASAIEVYPGHLPSIQALTRLQIRSGNVDESTGSMLRLIVSRGDPAWSSWARKQLASNEF